jgi:transcriptional regulator with XRE-family HTH domain
VKSLYVYGASKARRESETATPTTPTGWFYLNVQAELKARRWSARELARRTGMTPNFLTRARQGHQIALDSAAKVADILGVPLGNLIAPTKPRSFRDVKGKP